MAFAKASVLFFFFSVVLVLCDQPIAVGSSTKDIQTSVDNFHLEQPSSCQPKHDRIMEEAASDQESIPCIPNNSHVFTSDAGPSDTIILTVLLGFFIVGGLILYGGATFMFVMAGIAGVVTVVLSLVSR